MSARAVQDQLQLQLKMLNNILAVRHC